MSSHKRIAVIMAGGSGERFWPVSTPQRPKQFLNLNSPDSNLLQDSVARIEPLVGMDNVFIATGEHLVRPSQDAIRYLPKQNVWAEPTKRNTAGCLVWAAANAIAQIPDAAETVSVAVLTADHRIEPASAFRETVNTALELAECTGGLVTIGIKPSRPETGYGYIEVGKEVPGGFSVERFREKPDQQTAELFLESGDFLWNSGMFFWTLKAFLTEMATAQPEMSEAITGIAGAIKSGDDTQATWIFETIQSLPIDIALMEKSDKVYVVPAKFEWDDLGAWDAIARTYPTDEHGNVSLGDVRWVDSENCIAFTERDDIRLNLLGLKDMVVVVSGNEIVVCPKYRAQEVKKLAQS